MTKDKSYFAPVPNRALVDAGLTRLDLRVLGLIAAHDRFSANGLGCTLSTRRIADRLESKQPKVSASIQRLIEKGYVVAVANPKYAQKRMLAIVYDPAADKSVVSGRDSAATDTLQGISPAAATDTLQGIHKKLLSKEAKNIPKAARTNVRVALPTDFLDNRSTGETLRKLEGQGSLSKSEEEWCNTVWEVRDHGDALGEWVMRLLGGH